MKIIKEGILPKDLEPDPESEHKGVCDFCHAEFEFQAKEGTFYRNDPGGCLSVWCPTCKKPVYVCVKNKETK